MKPSKITILGTLAIIFGMICLYLENTYYQYVDEEGFLHESFFLPLGVFLIFVGVMTLLVQSIRFLVSKYFSR